MVPTSKPPSDVCGDCSAPDPQWVSVNRALLLCTQCCSVHRSFGRHISQIKSLRPGFLHPSLLNFVRQLQPSGANNVWEHELHAAASPAHSKSSAAALPPSKPSPTDPLHPNKAAFIRAKHLDLAYAIRPISGTKDTNEEVEIELSKQLHSAVRSANVETSLRLILQGANVNFFHREKGSTPLHVAAKFGQAAQIELLVLYGASLTALDSDGNSTEDIALANKHPEIAERLIEMMYEVTDTLASFLAEIKVAWKSSDHSRPARAKLQLIPNRMFEELVMDLYEEIDRREIEKIWTEESVPFLPANPFLSATRFQGRQKLARYDLVELAWLISDVLEDVKRRQNMAGLQPFKGSVSWTRNENDEDPLYDAVASDDDYAVVADPPKEDIVVLKRQLESSETKISDLQALVEKLCEENTKLKAKVSGCTPPPGSRVQSRPYSLHETASGSYPGSYPSLEFYGRRSTAPPNGSDVKASAEVITGHIQELWQKMQSFAEPENFSLCSEKIYVAVTEMNQLFPDTYGDEVVRNALKVLNQSAYKIKLLCKESSVQRQYEQALIEIRNAAYDLAMAVKTLVTHFVAQ